MVTYKEWLGDWSLGFITLAWISGKCVLVSNVQQCVSAFVWPCLQVFGKMRDPCVIPFTLLLLFSTSWLLWLHKLKIAIRGTRFKAVSSIEQTVTRELKAVQTEVFSWAFSSLYEWCKCVPEQAWTVWMMILICIF